MWKAAIEARGKGLPLPNNDNDTTTNSNARIYDVVRKPATNTDNDANEERCTKEFLQRMLAQLACITAAVR
jgi:hypothetical protein